MNDTRCYTKEFMTEFIELYRSLPELWYVKSKDYTDRHKKNAAYQQLVDKLKEVEPTATRDMVTKKINSMRTSRRKVKIKVEESRNSGEADEVYVPSLWYYNLMDFLDNQDSIQDQSSFDEAYSQDDSDMAVGVSSPEQRPPSRSSVNSAPDRASSEQSYFRHSPILVTSEVVRPKRLKKRAREVNVLDSIGKQLSEVKPDHTHEIFGRYVAHKLRHLPKSQSIYLKKIINDAVFEAELGNLERGCYVHIPTHDKKQYFNSP